MSNINNNIKEILVSEDELASINKKLGQMITKDYKNKNLLIIGLLKGCIPFVGDLMKNIDLDLRLEFLKVSSYLGTSSTGNVKIKEDITINVEGYDVLIIDDILDTGRTTSFIKELFIQRNAKSVKVCCLLDKKEGRVIEFDADYIGKDIPNLFVVGYGLDFNEKYRNLPYIGILNENYYK